MSDTIPASFATVVEAVESICAEFDSKDNFHQLDSDRWVRDVNVADSDIHQVSFLLDVAAPLLAVYVILQVPQPGRAVEGLAKALARANYGLLPGCFELDLDTGETRYRSVMALLSLKISPRDVAQLLSDALLTGKTYAPAFQKIVQTGADPILAVDGVEAG